MLSRVGRGKFTLGEGKRFIPDIPDKMRLVHTRLKARFPFLNSCLWSTSVFNEFMIHQPGRFYLLVEVEKDAIESVFFFMKESKYSVFLDPTPEIIYRYVPDEKETWIVKPLVSEAPTQKIAGISTVTIEKMLVDLFCDGILYAAQQGSERVTIFREAFEKYTINESRMLRYAGRRRKKEELRSYLNSISKLRQQS